MSFSSGQLFESLEGRSLMSATPTFAARPAPEMHAPQNEAAISQPILHAANRNRTLLGTWKGSVQANVLGVTTQKISFQLKVTKQTATSLTGSITVQGVTYKGTVALKWNGQKKFSFTYSSPQAGGTFTCTLKGGKLAGTFDGYGGGFVIVGKMSASKV